MRDARDDAAMKKFMDELAAVDLDDLDDDFQGVTVDAPQWEKYQAIVKALFTAKDKAGGKILKINCLETPDPLSECASAMVVMPCALWFDGEAKEAMIQAASLCDRIAVTTSGDKIRASFTIDRIWKEPAD